MGIITVCSVCGSKATVSGDHVVSITEWEHRLWMNTGERPSTIAADGLGDRTCTPRQSRTESAYRRGVAQAISWVRQNSLSPERVEEAEDAAMEMRNDGKDHGAFLDELLQRIGTR